MHPCVGVDVSKHHLDWTFGEDGPVEHLPNTLVGIRRLLDRLRRQEPALVAVESTGGYERRLVMALQDGGLPVVLVNPWRVRRFGEGLGRLAKTDPIDARLLALYADRANPARRPLPGPKARRMAELVARRRQLIEIVVAEKSRPRERSRLAPQRHHEPRHGRRATDRQARRQSRCRDRTRP